MYANNTIRADMATVAVAEPLLPRFEPADGRATGRVGGRTPVGSVHPLFAAETLLWLDFHACAAPAGALP